MMDSITQTALSLAQHAGLWGYWFALVAALAETVFLLGLLMPGSTLLLLMGMLAGQGIFDLGDLLFFAIVGATLGDNVNYFLGRRYGRHWLREDRWFLKTEHVAKAENFFDRHGGKSVFLGRFVPSVKEIMPFVAGMAGMERRSFMVWNLLGAIGWGCQWILPGYIFSQSLSLAQTWLSRVGILVLVLVFTLLIFYGLRWSILRFGPSGFEFARSILASLANAVSQNREVVRLVRRFPRTTSFFRQRLDHSRWVGLPLTLTGLIGLYLLALFSGLAEDVITGDTVVGLDTRVDALLESVRTPFFNHLFYTITSFGYWPVIASAAAALSFGLWYRRRGTLVLPLAISVVSCELLTFLGKLAIHRARPDGGVLSPSGFSFPSGHASISVAFYGFAIYIAMRFARLWSTRINLLMLGMLTIFLIGFSRLYLGVHYLSDVLAGYLIGAMGLMLGISATYLIPAHARHIGFPFRVTRGVRLAGTIGGLLSALVLVLMFNIVWAPELSIQPTPIVSSALSPSPPSVLKYNDHYAASIIGKTRAPINVIFVARDIAQVRACSARAGWLMPDPISWHSVTRAYFNAFRGTAYPTAPLSPWFWNGEPQSLGLVQPGPNNHVFDRGFLRVWATRQRLDTGAQLFVATIGQEKRSNWRLVPKPLSNFNHVRLALGSQLNDQGLARVTDVPYPDTSRHAPADRAVAHDGRISVVELTKTCSKED